MSNTHIRINPLFLLISLLPILVIVSFWMQSFRSVRSKPYQILSDGSYRICLNLIGCETYSPQEVEAGRKLGPFEYASFDTDLKLAKQEQFGDVLLFLFWSAVILGYVFLVLLIFAKNKIYVTDGIITIHSRLPMIRSEAPMVLKDFQWKTSNYSVVPINQIEKITIMTTTPHIPIRTDISQLNWRDRVEILYQDKPGSTKTAMIELFIFPSFKRVVADMVDKFPSLPIEYSKKTHTESLTDQFKGIR